MSEFIVQKIRSCDQCGAVLPLKCKGCIKHPQRKPVVREYFSWPKFLKTSPCGCVLIACQREGCSGTRWQQLNHSGRGGTSVSKRLFCSQKCVAIQREIDQDIRIIVKCAWDGKPIKRAPSKLASYACCNPTCAKLYQAKQAFDRKHCPSIADEMLKSVPKYWVKNA